MTASVDLEYAVGLDIGGTKTEGVVVDGAGTVLASLVRATPYGASAVVEASSAMVTELLADSGVGLAPNAPWAWAFRVLSTSGRARSSTRSTSASTVSGSPSASSSPLGSTTRS